MASEQSKLDALAMVLAGQRLAWLRRWWWLLVVFALLTWLPVASDLLRDLWSLLKSSRPEFFQPAEDFFEGASRWGYYLLRSESDLHYFGPALRRLCAIGAALGLASNLMVPQGQVEASELYTRYRRAVRSVVYAWMAVLMLIPALISMLVYLGQAGVSAHNMRLMAFPVLLLGADWVSLCEFQQFSVLRYPRAAFLGRYLVALAVAGVYMLANFYTPLLFDRGLLQAPAWLTAGLAPFLVGVSLILALLWWSGSRQPPQGFPQCCSDKVSRAGWVKKLAATPDGNGGRWAVWRRRLTLGGIACALVVVLAYAWLIVLRSGVLADPDRWPEPALDVPVISTRGHCRHGRLAPEHGAYSYSVNGEIAGFTAGTEAPVDLLVVVHGFNNTMRKARYKFDIAQHSVSANGFSGALIGFSWDADTQRDPLGTTGYHTADTHATLNGSKLAKFLLDYRERCPATRLHLVGYSMGARVALETLLALDNDPELGGGSFAVDSVNLLGASVDDEDVEVGERYGRAIERRAGVLINYYSREDNALGGYYPFKKADRALGEVDIEHPGRKPLNYVSRDVEQELITYNEQGNAVLDDMGNNHSGYLGNKNEDGVLLDDGVLDRVVDEIRRLADGTSAGSS